MLEKIMLLFRKNKSKTENENPVKAETPAYHDATEEELDLLKELGDALVEVIEEEAAHFDKLTQQFFATEENRKSQTAGAFLSIHWERCRQRCFDKIYEYLERMDEQRAIRWRKRYQAWEEEEEFILPSHELMQLLLFEFEDDAAEKIINAIRRRLRYHGVYAKWWKRFVVEGSGIFKPIRILHGRIDTREDCLVFDEEFNVFATYEYAEIHGRYSGGFYFFPRSPEWVSKEYHGRFDKYPAQIPSRAVRAYYRENDSLSWEGSKGSFLGFIRDRLCQ